MTFSDHDIQWSHALQRWLVVQVRKPRRYRTNLLPGRLALHAAKMTQSAPSWTCLPEDDTVVAEETARYCDRLLKFGYRENHIDLVRFFTAIQSDMFGLGIAELLVEDEASVEPVFRQQKSGGKLLFDQESGLPVYEEDENGNMVIDSVEAIPGIKCRPLSPFAFAVPPGLQWPLLDDSPYCIRATWLSEQYIRRRFEVGKDVVLENDGAGHYDTVASYLWQSHYLDGPRQEDGKLLVLQYYERAKDVRGFYQGKIYTVCGDHLIGNESSLWDDGRYPFFVFPGLPIPDSFYPFAWMDPQMDPQARINQTLTHQMDHLARVGSPLLIADRGSGFTGKPVFQYKTYFNSPGMRRPEWLAAAPLPPGAYEMTQMAKVDMDAVSLTFGPSRGEATPGATSGLQVRMMQDADQTEMGPIVRLHAQVFGRMGEAYLELMRKHGGKDRTIASMGDGSRPEFIDFMRSRIPVKSRVVVQEDSLLVHYRSALIEEAQQMASLGVFGNFMTEPQARERYLLAVRDPKLAGPLTPEQIQKQFIDEIHFRIIHEGEEIHVEPWWDINAHREAAQVRLLRESLRWDPQTKQRFLAFWQELEETATKLEEQARQKQQQMADEQIANAGKLAKAEEMPKTETEMLRQAGKLALESMKDGSDAAGQGAGVAAASGLNGQNSESGAEGESNGRE